MFPKAAALTVLATISTSQKTALDHLLSLSSKPEEITSSVPEDPCQWSGVTCENDAVVALDLARWSLQTRPVPELLSSLGTSLRILTLSGNKGLGGSTTAFFGGYDNDQVFTHHVWFTKVMHLKVDGCRLDGEFPPLWDGLVTAEFGRNYLHGSFPAAVDLPSTLEVLILSGNSGLEDGISRLLGGAPASKLRVVHASDTGARGSIELAPVSPTSSSGAAAAASTVGLTALSLLTDVEVSRSFVIGPVPPALVGHPRLARLDLTGNAGINGSVPAELCSGTAQHLEILALGGTRVDGFDTAPCVAAGTIASGLKDLTLADAKAVRPIVSLSTVFPALETVDFGECEAMFSGEDVPVVQVLEDVARLPRLRVLSLKEAGLTLLLRQLMDALAGAFDTLTELNLAENSIRGDLDMIVESIEFASLPTSNGLPPPPAIRLLVLDENPRLKGILAPSLFRFLPRLREISLNDCPEISGNVPQSWSRGKVSLVGSLGISTVDRSCFQVELYVSPLAAAASLSEGASGENLASGAEDVTGSIVRRFIRPTIALSLAGGTEALVGLTSVEIAEKAASAALPFEANTASIEGSVAVSVGDPPQTLRCPREIFACVTEPEEIIADASIHKYVLCSCPDGTFGRPRFDGTGCIPCPTGASCPGTGRAYVPGKWPHHSSVGTTFRSFAAVDGTTGGGSSTDNGILNNATASSSLSSSSELVEVTVNIDVGDGYTGNFASEVGFTDCRETEPGETACLLSVIPESSPADDADAAVSGKVTPLEVVCADGYEGRTCGRCATDFFRLGSRCLQCDSRLSWMAPAAAVARALGLVILVVRTDVLAAGLFRILMSHLQILSLLQSTYVPVPSFVSDPFVVMGTSAVPTSRTGWECSLSSAPGLRHSFIVAAVAPAICGFLGVIAFAAGVLFPSALPDAKMRSATVMLYAWLSAALADLRVLAAPLNCRSSPGGEYYVDTAPWVHCSWSGSAGSAVDEAGAQDSKAWPAMAGVSIVLLPAYAFGTLVILYFVWRKASSEEASRKTREGDEERDVPDESRGGQWAGRARADDCGDDRGRRGVGARSCAAGEGTHDSAHPSGTGISDGVVPVPPLAVVPVNEPELPSSLGSVHDDHNDARSGPWWRRFGLLFLAFRPGAQYWEGVIAARRILLAIAQGLIPWDSTFMPTLVFVALLSSLVLQIMVEPFATRTANRAERGSLFILTVTFFIAAVVSASEERTSLSSSSRALFGVSLSCNLVFMVVIALIWALQVFRKAKTLVRENF